MTSSKELQGIAALDGVLSLILFPLYVLFYGFVLTQMWAWFMVPLGVRAITLSAALGLSAMIHVTRPVVDSKLEGPFAGTVAFAKAFAHVGCCWGFGAIYVSVGHMGWFR